MNSLILLLGLSLVGHAQSPDPAPTKPAQKAVAKKAPKTKSENKISETKTDKPVFDKQTEPEPKAEPEPGTWDKIKEKAADAAEFGAEQTQSLSQSLGATRERRGSSEWYFTGNYSVFEMWVLSKYGLTVGYNRSPSSSYELEYMRGSLGFGYFGLDIGSIDEEKLALNWRSYNQRNAFYFLSGIYYNKLDVHLGNKMLSSVSNGQQAHVDIMELQTVGVSWGLGNRWQTRGGFVWGADWLVINVPVWIVKQSHPFIDSSNDPEMRDDASDTMKILRRVPAIAALKIQLGFSF